MPTVNDAPAAKPVVVSANAGVIDSIQAASRYIVVIVGFIISVLGLLKVHDIAGMIALIQSNGGQLLAAISGLVALGTAAYGVFKSHKRGAQIATVAADPRVPDRIATTSGDFAMKKFIITCLAFVLVACAVPSIPLHAPAPLAATTIDDKALEAAWKSFDVALDAINLLIDAKQIKVGSPKALAIANGIDRVTAALAAAEHAAAAGSTTSYLSALADAKAAITNLRTALALKG